MAEGAEAYEDASEGGGLDNVTAAAAGKRIENR